jgi:hypothetical protein
MTHSEFTEISDKKLRYTKSSHLKKNIRLPIFYYAFHSKPQSTDKLHIVVHSHTRNPSGPADKQPDPSLEDYGLIVESECGLKGILLRPDKDAIREGDFEGMGLKHFREKFSDIDIIYFFMPPVLRVSISMLVAMAKDMIPENKVCEICKNHLKANVREASTVSEEQQPEEAGQQKGKEEQGEGKGYGNNFLFLLSLYL